MASKIFNDVRKNISNDSKQFISNSFSIVNYIHDLLEKKNLTQKELALKLGKTESEVSKILSLGHNITLKNLSKIEVALEEKIINTPNHKLESKKKVHLKNT